MATTTNALPEGTQAFEFGALQLHGVLLGWQDTRKRRVANHEFDRRDGGQTEDMGRAQHQLRVTLYFADSAGLDTARQFVRLIDENPTRLLIHPLYGRMTMTCMGIDGASLQVQVAVNCYTIPCDFIESNLDAQIVSQSNQGVPATSQAVNINAALVLAYLNQFSAIATELNSAAGTSMAFASAAYSAATNQEPNPGLPSLLDGAVNANQAAILALRATSGDSPEAADAVAAVQVLAASCLDLGAAYLAQRPPVIEYVTQEPVHVLVLASMLYPGTGTSRVDEILANNPQIIGGIAESGTRLQVASV